MNILSDSKIKGNLPDHSVRGRRRVNSYDFVLPNSSSHGVKGGSSSKFRNVLFGLRISPNDLVDSPSIGASSYNISPDSGSLAQKPIFSEKSPYVVRRHHILSKTKLTSSDVERVMNNREQFIKLQELMRERCCMTSSSLLQSCNDLIYERLQEMNNSSLPEPRRLNVRGTTECEHDETTRRGGDSSASAITKQQRKYIESPDSLIALSPERSGPLSQDITRPEHQLPIEVHDQLSTTLDDSHCSNDDVLSCSSADRDISTKSLEKTSPTSTLVQFLFSENQLKAIADISPSPEAVDEDDDILSQ